MTTQKKPRGPGKSSRIRQVVADFRARLTRGENLTEEDLIVSHPELMPELAEFLVEAASSDDSQQADVESPGDAARDPRLIVDPEIAESSVTATFDSVVTRAHQHTATVGAAGVTPRIGHYEILELLGEGGFGHVYLAKDVDLDRPVAIKIAKPTESTSSSGASFREEAKRVTQLNHPAIVKILDISRGDIEAWYLVMEYVDGPSLAEVYREGDLSIAGLVRLLTQVADGIHHAHTHQILHRDLKPANVLLGKDGRPRIVDFGMALQAHEQVFAPRQASGTPYCMAPEQVRGEIHRLDARTDVWSFGVMLYEGLTGRRPFADKGVENVFEAILSKDPLPPAQLNPAVPPELERICLKCLSKRMADRYRSADELSAELQHWLAEAENRSSKEIAAERAATSMAEIEPVVRVVPRGLRTFGGDDASFFLELLPGPRNRAGLPESVQFWTRIIENVEQRAEFSVAVLYGPSGTGKSSFIRAGVLPRCANSFSTVLVDAATANLERELLVSLHRVCSYLPVQIDLARACATIRQGGPSGSVDKVLIVLDQFEQWLYTNQVDESAELIRALRHCDGVHLQCLLIVRSDFWVGITRFMRQLELPMVEGLNSAHLDLFDARHARKVLTLLGQSYGNLPPSPEEPSSDQQQFIEEAVAQVTRDGWIMPVRLALLAEMMKAQQWNVETLRKLGGERGIGVSYLEQVFASPLAAPSHRRYRKAAEGALRALLPEAGVELKGRGRTQHELKQASGLADRPERFQELIEILDSQLRLITPTEGAMSHAATAEGFESSACVSTKLPTFQLTHDYLVPSLREWLTREQQSTRQGRAQLLLEERDRLWRQEKQARFLPSLSEALRIAALTKWQDWTASQRAMLKHSATVHVRRLLIAFVSALGLAALLYAWMPPDPLPIYLDPQQPAAARNAAFDRLDLSGVAALGPVLAAMKLETNSEVFEHTVVGLEQLAQSLPAAESSRGDSVRDLILSVAGELLRREPSGEELSDGRLRSRLFEIYSALASPEETLKFVADQSAQGVEVPEQALSRYFHKLAESHLLVTSFGEGGTAAGNQQMAVNLVELIDVLPAGQARDAAARLLDEPSTSERVDLFTRSFVAEPYSLSSRSLSIYVNSKPTPLQAGEARRHLTEIGKQIDRHMSHQSELTSDEFVYLLANVTELQAYVDERDDKLARSLVEILNRRSEFPEGGVIDEACGAFAAVMRYSRPNSDPAIVSLEPLIETLRDSNFDAESRAAAAQALGTIGSASCIDDLGAIALNERLPEHLRLAAIGGLGEIGRQATDRESELDQVTQIFVRLIGLESSGSSSGMLGEVLEKFALFAPMTEFHRFSELLAIHDENVYAERATYIFLLRFPEHAQEIVDQTLQEAVHLTADQTRSLLPSPDKMFGELPQIRAFHPDEEVLVSCRALAIALANTTALHPDASVRRLAGQNLRQLLISSGLPAIDVEGQESDRKQQLSRWQSEWKSVSNQLTFTAGGQLGVHSEETLEQPSR